MAKGIQAIIETTAMATAAIADNVYSMGTTGSKSKDFKDFSFLVNSNILQRLTL